MALPHLAAASSIGPTRFTRLQFTTKPVIVPPNVADPDHESDELETKAEEASEAADVSLSDAGETPEKQKEPASSPEVLVLTATEEPTVAAGETPAEAVPTPTETTTTIEGENNDQS